MTNCCGTCSAAQFRWIENDLYIDCNRLLKTYVCKCRDSCDGNVTDKCKKYCEERKNLYGMRKCHASKEHTMDYGEIDEKISCLNCRNVFISPKHEPCIHCKELSEHKYASDAELEDRACELRSK